MYKIDQRVIMRYIYIVHANLFCMAVPIIVGALYTNPSLLALSKLTLRT